MNFNTLMFVFKLKTHGCFLKLWYILYIDDVFKYILCLYPCCFCKLLGLCFMHWFVGFIVCTMLLCSLYALFIQYFYLNVMHFPFKYCHSCALIGLFLDAYT